MNTVLLIGSHPRHFYVAQAAIASGFVAGIVIEQREPFVPSPPPGLDDDLANMFRLHFADRDSAERRFFGDANGNEWGCQTLHIGRDELNSAKVWDFLDGLRPDLVLSYGVHKLSHDTLAHMPGAQWNVHGGLSPWYRGVITLFWPSYMLEPQMTGMTVHELTEKIDGGHIVHQSAAELVRGDGIHDLACRAVVSVARDLQELLSRLADRRMAPPVTQKTSGRIWRARDWRPEHLRLIYDSYSNRIVDRYLDGEFRQAAPHLVRQF